MVEFDRVAITERTRTRNTSGSVLGEAITHRFGKGRSAQFRASRRCDRQGPERMGVDCACQSAGTEGSAILGDGSIHSKLLKIHVDVVWKGAVGGGVRRTSIAKVRLGVRRLGVEGGL
jgi:hypothetical protein